MVTMANPSVSSTRKRQSSIVANTAKVAALLIGGVFAILALPFLPIAAGMLYYSFFPWYAADHNVGAVRTNVLLEFYLLSDEAKDDGRYLTITNAAGRKRFEICGIDWAHYSRTNLYLTEDNNLAVEGVKHCDYVVALDKLELITWRGPVPDKWTYLGAFEIVADAPSRERKLRFIDASEKR